MEETAEGYILLRAAVIAQACKDYETARVLGEKSTFYQMNMPVLKEFFAGRGTWEIWAGDIAPEYVFRRIKTIGKGWCL